VSWQYDDEVVTNYRSIVQTQKEAFQNGEKAERQYWLDFVEEHTIHDEEFSCKKCDTLRFLATIMKLRHDY
jgi:hypothetical protein